MEDRSISKKVAPPLTEWRKRLCIFCGRFRDAHAVTRLKDGSYGACCQRCWERRTKGRRLNYSSEY